MPLDWLGQLKPSMKQQIALQRALLALQREDEEIRAKTPALARGLGAAPSAAPGPAIPGGPTYAARGGREPAFKGGMEYTPVTREPLAQALATGTPGYISGEERMRMAREEIAVGREELAGKASEFWARIEPLDDAGEKIALDACRKHQPELYEALIEQGYVDETTGAAVGLEKEKKVAFRTTRISDGWEYEDLVFEDGTTETRTLGPAPEEAAAGLTVEQEIALGEYGMEMGEYAERHRTAAIKIMGDMPRPGIDTVNIEGKDVPATAEHANAWLEGVNALTAYLSAQAGEAPVEGEPTMSDVKAMYEGRPDLIGDVQEKLGIPRTEVWDEATEFAFSTYGEVLLGEEPAVVEGEVKPKFERQKKFWDKWLKTWGKVLRVKGVNIEGLTREEWEAKKGGQ